MYIEDREIDKNVLNKQKELLKKQGEFEIEQRLQEKSKEFLEKKENKKIKIINWVVIFFTLLFLILLFFLLL